MKPTPAIRRTLLLTSAAMALGLAAPMVAAQDSHGSDAGAAYQPSMTTLGALNLEIPGRREGDPVMTQEEYNIGNKIYFER